MWSSRTALLHSTLGFSSQDFWRRNFSSSHLETSTYQICDTFHIILSIFPFSLFTKFLESSYLFTWPYKHFVSLWNIWMKTAFSAFHQTITLLAIKVWSICLFSTLMFLMISGFVFFLNLMKLFFTKFLKFSSVWTFYLALFTGKLKTHK